MKVKIDQKKLSHIKEVYYACGTHPELDLVLIDYFDPLEDYWRDFDYAWMVYIDSPDKKDLLFCRLSNEDERKKLPKIKFIERVTSLNELDLYSLLYVCTLYQFTVKSEIASEIFTPHKNNLNSLNLFTSYSYGRIVYKHQAAFLYGLLTGCPGNEAVAWVTDMSLKKPSAVKLSKSLFVEKNITLFDVWRNMTINGFVVKANWEGANKLKGYLSNY